MLVLSRKLNQSIRIGENISISVLRVKGNAIQLGISAPKEIHVVRSELIERDAKDAQPVQLAKDNGAQSTDSAPASAQLAEDDTEAEPERLLEALRAISEARQSSPLNAAI